MDLYRTIEAAARTRATTKPEMQALLAKWQTQRGWSLGDEGENEPK